MKSMVGIPLSLWKKEIQGFSFCRIKSYDWGWTSGGTII